MSAQSLFSKKSIESQQPDTRTGLMEELNLPPGMIAFVRKNARNLQIGLISFVVLVLAWVFYDYYTELQENKGASLLASAMQTESLDERAWVLENVISDYSRTEAARWSKLELAHLDYQEGRFDAAVTKYEEVIARLSADNSLVPLARMNLAQIYEETAQYDQAIAQYILLKKSIGFGDEARLALGRIYTAKDQTAQARKEYEELLAGMEDEADPLLRSRVKALLISSGGENIIPASQPEENKK
ncbi:MAG: tetratricopeptide repeat protein [Desulfobulbaceae bacterium]|nr:tetratricopeptide repeat protein [Desulfobulbaceae bacterium]